MFTISINVAHTYTHCSPDCLPVRGRWPDIRVIAMENLQTARNTFGKNNNRSLTNTDSSGTDKLTALALAVKSLTANIPGVKPLSPASNVPPPLPIAYCLLPIQSLDCEPRQNSLFFPVASLHLPPPPASASSPTATATAFAIPRLAPVQPQNI